MNPLTFLRRKIERRVKKIQRIYKFYIITPLIAKDANTKVVNSKKRGLFLDCGSNIGQGFNFFRKYFKNKNFDYELFEPNPNCLPFLYEIQKKLDDHNIIIHDKAVGIKNETLTFYGLTEPDGGGALSQGGSVLPEHNSATYQPNEDSAIQVQSIDFVKFIEEKIKKYETIVIKMDIEGGEYEVLNHMLNKNIFPSIHSIFCEFHSQYMKEDKKIIFKNIELDLTKKIKKTKCKFNLWI